MSRKVEEAAKERDVEDQFVFLVKVVREEEGEE